MTKPPRPSKPRKPRESRFKSGDGAYWGFMLDQNKSSFDHMVYVGGDYYEGSAQIHLSEADLRPLGEFLIKAADWADSRKAAK